MKRAALLDNLKWLIVIAVLSVVSFMAGRSTSGSESRYSVLPSAAPTNVQRSIFSENRAARGGTASPAWSSSGIEIPQDEYTLESFKETARRVNLIRGYRPARLMELAAVQQALGRQNVRGLIDQLVEDNSAGIADAVYLAFGVYAEQSPQEALDYVLENSDKKNLSSSMKMVVAANMEIRPHETMLKLQQIKNETQRSKAIRNAIAALAGKDPARAFEVTQEFELKDGRYESASTLFMQWGREDPRSATRALAKITDPKTHAEAIENMVWNWTKDDPKAAWEWAQQQPVGAENYNDPRAQTLRAWADADPIAALEAALTLENPGLKKASVPRIVREWSKREPEAALAWVTSQEDVGLMSDSLRQMTYDGQISHDRLFQVMMEKMPAGRTYQHSMSNLIHRWADKDPAAAAAAVAAMPPGQIYANSMRTIASNWAKSDPDAALHWVRQLPAGKVKQSAQSNIFRQLAEKNPELARTQYDRLSAQDRDRVGPQIAQGLVQRDPQEAIRFTAAMVNPEIRQQAQESVARQWARNDPQNAATWARTLPEENRSNTLASVVDTWAGENAEAAAEWLAKFPPEPALDQSTANLTRYLQGEDPAAAVSWAESITDENMRKNTVNSVLHQWFRYDPGSARQWVQNSSLSPEQKKTFLNKR